jgi:23S rRNA (uracil1939-C5)-methyltransferase
VTLSGKAVPAADRCLLQATADGETALIDAVREAVGEARASADLFAGIGTFALALPGKVRAAEASRDAVLALKRAAPNLAAEHRDLYRRPLMTAELADLDAVVLDPPRSGAEAQVAELAASAVPRIAYVAATPPPSRATRACSERAAARWVRPVGQFPLVDSRRTRRRLFPLGQSRAA